jgi:hypothetical protein
MAGSGKISNKQYQAIAALLISPSVSKAAETVGIGERTVWRWLKIEEFKTAYKQARSELVRHATAQIQAGMSRAVNTLTAIMEDPDAPASSRVSAARCVLDMGLRASEIEELESRIAALEARI